MASKNKSNHHKVAYISEEQIPEPEDWYEKLSDQISGELKGYFKFTIRDNEEQLKIYNIWWEGLADKTRISDHDMPQEEFIKYQKTILNRAQSESYKAYKEVMTAYAGEL